ncbi:MAG: hypothetical protein HY063_06570 [Bacteroidetes bacterium]|nr:hypothetical protein [Bacteroidota bacterium]
MKKLLLFIGFIAIVFSSCLKPGASKTNDEIQFTNLSADTYTLSKSASTKITATVQNACPEITYHWSVNSGSISGSSAQVVYNAPAGASQITVSCTVNHPGKQSKTKSVSININ